jgi:hypothetical protein
MNEHPRVEKKGVFAVHIFHGLLHVKEAEPQERPGHGVPERP